MDLRPSFRRELTRRQKWTLAGGACLALLLLTLVMAYLGRWDDVRGMWTAGVLGGASAGLLGLVRAWLRRLVARRAWDLEQHVRLLGFTPSASDGRMNVRADAHGEARCWVEDPILLRGNLHIWFTSFLVINLFVSFVAGYGLTATAGAFGAVVLLIAWSNRRATIKVEHSQ